MNLKLSTASQYLNPGGLYKQQNICSTSAKTYFMSFSCKAHEPGIGSIPSPVKHPGNPSCIPKAIAESSCRRVLPTAQGRTGISTAGGSFVGLGEQKSRGRVKGKPKE